MVRQFLMGLATRVRGGDGEPEDGDGKDGETDDGGFVRSRLDASVLYAHGMGNAGAEREIANVEEKARLLDERQRRDE